MKFIETPLTKFEETRVGDLVKFIYKPATGSEHTYYGIIRERISSDQLALRYYDSLETFSASLRDKDIYGGGSPGTTSFSGSVFFKLKIASGKLKIKDLLP